MFERLLMMFITNLLDVSTGKLRKYFSGCALGLLTGYMALVLSAASS